MGPKPTPDARQTPESAAARPRPASGAPRWLLLVHQLPARPTSLRVRIWRRLQQVGALAVKQSVYVLPDSPSGREDFEWLKTEIEAGGGQASVFAADTVDAWSADALIDEFRRSREESYAALARDAEAIRRQLDKGRRRTRATPPRRALQRLRERLSAVERVDFFGSAGRDRVLSLVREIEAHANPRPRSAAGDGAPPSYRARLWVTRPRPGVDRMACAWLIRRFIDPRAEFGFVADRGAAPAGAVPFDMFGAEFSHRGASCTFETLCDVFRLDDPALARLAEIVHDLDLKDDRFGPAETAAIGQVIEGLRLAEPDDGTLLSQGITLFEALYQSFAQATRASGPRPVAKRRTATRPRRGRSSR